MLVYPTSLIPHHWVYVRVDLTKQSLEKEQVIYSLIYLVLFHVVI